MTRLMQPRPVRTSVRAVVGAVRTVEGSTGPLTMVTHPPGASSPMVTEPPEAGFIMEAAATLAELQVRHQPPVTPRPGFPLIPVADLPMAGALMALEGMIRSVRPEERPARRLSSLWREALVLPKLERPAIVLPGCEPEWPPSLGLVFRVEGLEDIAGSTPAVAGVSEPSLGAPPVELPGTFALKPVAHRSIPPRRGQRELTILCELELGTERLLPQPILPPPRLRIHLPKPVLNPFRPRYAFAPRVVDEPTVKEEPRIEDKPAAKEAAQVAPSPAKPNELPASKPAREERKSDPLPEAKQVRIVAPKPQLEPKPEPKSEPKPEQKSAPAAAPKVEEKPKPAVERRPEPKPEPEAEKAVPIAAPSFGGQADAAPEGFLSRIPGWQKAIAALIIAGIAVGAWAVPAIKRASSRPMVLPVAAAAAPTSLGVESWVSESAGDTAGSARRRTISGYKPGRDKRDYVFEFSGQIEQRAIGWVFRMKDPKNYYCLKLEQTGEGARAKTRLVKFAVVDGEEQPHRLVPLKESLTAGATVNIRLDVRGQSFATQVNGRPVDVWIDNQIASGTVGFSNESGERAIIRTVKVTY
ncbi:MAG: hypothetical protein HYX27_04270 [Acidobacteria bacterium]|nr:hypothetical protein [Acidobacteriota bacterium]